MLRRGMSDWVGPAHQALEGGGYRGHYMLAFGSREDMLEGREVLVRVAGAA